LYAGEDAKLRNKLSDERQGIYFQALRIKDRFFNPRYYTRRAIKKLYADPALFDNSLLISDLKKAIAARS